MRLPTEPFAGLLHGFALPFHGLRLALGVPALRRWSLAMIAITALSLVALVVALPFVVPDLLASLWSRPAGWWIALWYAAAALLFSLGLVIGVAILPAVVTAPLADPLIEATERHLGLPGPGGGGIARLAAETASGMGKALLRVALLLAGHALLLPLLLLPGAGQAAWTGLSIAWTIFWLVFEYLDLPANRFGYRFRDVGATIRSHAAVSAGFGSALYLLLWVPLINTLFIPAATVGATLLFHQLLAAGRLRGALPAAPAAPPAPRAEAKR